MSIIESVIKGMFCDMPDFTFKFIHSPDSFDCLVCYKRSAQHVVSISVNESKLTMRWTDLNKAIFAHDNMYNYDTAINEFIMTAAIDNDDDLAKLIKHNNEFKCKFNNVLKLQKAVSLCFEFDER